MPYQARLEISSTKQNRYEYLQNTGHWDCAKFNSGVKLSGFNCEHTILGQTRGGIPVSTHIVNVGFGNESGIDLYAEENCNYLVKIYLRSSVPEYVRAGHLKLLQMDDTNLIDNGKLSLRRLKIRQSELESTFKPLFNVTFELYQRPIPHVAVCSNDLYTDGEYERYAHNVVSSGLQMLEMRSVDFYHRWNEVYFS